MGDGVQKELNQEHFDSVIRNVKTASMENVQFLRNATFQRMRQLRIKRDVSKAVKGIPKGSDQLEPGSIVRWMNNVGKKDTKAVQQLIAIDATAVQRSS